MNSKKEELLIQSLHALGMRKEPLIAVLSMLKTDKQAEMIFDWIDKHYQENPSEEEILDVAQAIKEQVK